MSAYTKVHDTELNSQGRDDQGHHLGGHSWCTECAMGPCVCLLLKLEMKIDSLKEVGEEDRAGGGRDDAEDKVEVEPEGRGVKGLLNLHEVLLRKEKERSKEMKGAPRSRRTPPRRKPRPPQPANTPTIKNFFPGIGKPGPATTTTAAGGGGTAVPTAVYSRNWPGDTGDTQTRPPDTLTQKRKPILGVTGRVGTNNPSSECQPAHTDVLQSGECGRVSATVAGSVRRGVSRQKEEEDMNIVVPHTTTTKVSPVVHDVNCVVVRKMTSGPLGVKQLSEKFNALSQESGDGGGRRPGHIKRVCGDGDELGWKKTSDEPDLLCSGRGERRRGSVKEVQPFEYSRTLRGEIEGRGLPCGGQSSILTADSADTGLGTNFGELGEETRRRR